MPRVLAISLAYLIIVATVVIAFYLLLPRLGNVEAQEIRLLQVGGMHFDRAVGFAHIREEGTHQGLDCDLVSLLRADIPGPFAAAVCNAR